MSRVPRWSPSASSVKSILARVDGALDVSDIAALTNLPEGAVEHVVASLVAAGVLTTSEAGAPGQPGPASAPPPARASLVPPGLHEPVRRASSEVALGGGLPPLSDEEQRRISDVYAKLNKIDHYRLLGVAATADTKHIKRAYYALAKLHHPDRYFRKDVGVLRPKIDAVFAAMTNALDTLTDAQRRATYDAYLHDLLKTRLLRRSAEALEAKLEWQAAADVWERVVEQLPTDAYIQHRQAYALLRARASDPSLAIAAAARAIQLDPTRAEYRFTAACLYLASGRERSAAAELEVACEIEPDRADYAGLLAAVTERVRSSP